MIDLLKVVSRLEETGGSLLLDGDRIRYFVPRGNLEAQAFLTELRKHRSEVAALLRARAIIPVMPPGVRLVRWNLKEPPVGIETCAVVTDSALFARTTLEQLGTALSQPKRWVGWSVPQLMERLAQVGVIVVLATTDIHSGEIDRTQ